MTGAAACAALARPPGPAESSRHPPFNEITSASPFAPEMASRSNLLSETILPIPRRSSADTTSAAWWQMKAARLASTAGSAVPRERRSVPSVAPTVALTTPS
jgi:hypothetical protein